MRKILETESCLVARCQFIFPLFCSVLSLEESVKAMSLSAEEDDIPWDSIRDNRDLTVFTSWDPKERSSFICSQFGPSLSFSASVYASFFYFPRRLADEHRRLSLEEETVWLRIRSLTLRLVTSMASLGHTCVQNAETANENGIGDKASILSSLLSQLTQTLQTAAQLVEKRVQVCRRRGVQWRLSGPEGLKTCVLLQYPFLGPPSTRLAPALSIGSCHCQAAALQLCVHLQELELLGLGQNHQQEPAAH